jgi:hypothetical protein
MNKLPDSIPSILERGDFDEATDIPTLTTYNSLSPELATELREKGRWHLILFGDGADAQVLLENGAAHVHIEDGGRIWYSIQFCYLPLPLEADRVYTIRFDARADRPRTMVFEIAHVGDDWFSHSGRHIIRLGTEWNTCEFNILAMRPEPQARFEFNLGNDPSDVYFDNVTVIEAGI